MRVWNALIDGPADTCYEDGLFTLRMEFTGIRYLIKYFIKLLV
jgi:ubiquitin-protein ligase